MYKIYTNAKVNGKEYSVVFADNEKEHMLIYGMDHWRLRKRETEVEGKVVSNPELKKALTEFLKNVIKEETLRAELDKVSRENYWVEERVKEHFGSICPTAKFIKEKIEHTIGSDLWINSYTCSPTATPEHPHSLTIAKVNDLGKHCDYVGYIGEDPQLLGDENKLMERFCPKAIDFKKTNFKKIKVVSCEKSYSVGDKRSCSFLTQYNITLNLTPKTIDTVIAELCEFAKLL